MTAQLILFSIIGWVTGEVLLRRAGPVRKSGGGMAERTLPEGIGAPERALAAVVGGIVFATAAMVLHLITGGAVFGVAPVVPVLAALWLARQRATWPPLRWPALPWRPLVALGAVLALLYIAPAVVAGSGVRSGDPPWHLGWTEQLLGGEAVPTGPAPELGRNAYPWGWHALIATLVRLVPGSTPLVAHESLHVVVVAAIPLSAACLARRFDGRAGWTGAAAAGLIGGFGWLGSNPGLETSPSEAVGTADLVVTSPNALYALEPPALPRELGLVLLAGMATLLLLGSGSRRRELDVAAGVAAGLVGLVNVPLFLAAVLWAVAAVVAGDRNGRVGRLTVVVSMAAVVVGLWAGPVVAAYGRYGGFVDISKLGVEWSLPTALASWGLLLPLALAGIGLSARSHPDACGARVARRGLALVLATVLLLALALASRAFGWNLSGNATLLHQGRVWPPMHLLGASLGGVAIFRLYRALAARRRGAGVTALGALFILGVVSPSIAAVDMTEILRTGREGYTYGTAEVAPGSFVRRAAARLRPGDVVVVRPRDDDLAWLLWQLSGARLARYDDPRLEGNDLRIRYADLAAAWDRRMAGDGFAATAVARRVGDSGASTGEVMAAGAYGGQRWELVVRR